MCSLSRTLIALALLLGCARAFAQEAATEATPPAPPPSEPAPAAPPPAPTPESTDAAAARIAVARSKVLIAAGDYGAALAELTRAYELLHDDPRRADVLNNIAVCYERLFRYDLALIYYDRYLQESTTASAEDRAEVEAAMAALRDLLGTVHLSGQSGAEIWIDDHKLGVIPLEVSVPAGLHVLEARKTGYETSRRELRVSARAVHAIDVQLERVDTYRGLPSTYFWIGTGLTAAALVTGTVFGVAALSEHAQGERDAERGHYVDVAPARELALQADIAFGAAVALSVGTAVLFALTDWSSAPEAKRGAAARVSLAVSPVVVGFVLQGSSQ